MPEAINAYVVTMRICHPMSCKSHSDPRPSRTATFLVDYTVAHAQGGGSSSSSAGSGRKEPVDWGIVGPIFLFSALGGALFGYDIGATSGALPLLTSPELSGTDWCAAAPCPWTFA